MNPGLGVILFGGLGYVLVYAAVANHGRFATHPWAGVVADAYTSPASSSSSSGGQGVPAPQAPAPSAQGSRRPPATVTHGRSALGELEHIGAGIGRTLLGGLVP